MSGYKLLFTDNVSASADKKHFLTDWESNIDGHLMRATEKYLSGKYRDFDGFREYMRAVFKRPFVSRKNVIDWFEKMDTKIGKDQDMRKPSLVDLSEEFLGHSNE